MKKMVYYVDEMIHSIIVINKWITDLKLFMDSVKKFIEDYKGNEGFVTYNNYLRVKKIERLK